MTHRTGIIFANHIVFDKGLISRNIDFLLDKNKNQLDLKNDKELE